MTSFATTRVKPYEALTKAVAANLLTSKSALITGAGVSRIALVGRDLERINKANKNFQEAFPGTVFDAYSADIADEAKITSVFKEFGAPDIVINKADHFPNEGPFIKEDLKS
ncbi:uncharacterized protein Triagg1_9163 [Trichoderma aggressivum f. europaeum]|uniref:Short chain dehydrogenase n=1 Tax=Trichoderma aggressivum f. europaeum TaxID=173218 RepID=A0AAE1J2P0_9HYPO|nr:hypothetical protein Triagg1_9163 [Trichoderma aggressivum f. europaeum]